jgi:spore coat polysaccharide biosynthesis protein SpsF
MRKLAAALACRNQGSRLYGKPLQNIDVDSGITILDQIVSTLRKIRCIDVIVLGISEGNQNLAFIDFTKTNSLEYIIGDEKDVLQRLIQCGDKVQATDIFRVTTESPFLYYEPAEASWKDHIDKNADATFIDHIIDGTSFEIIKLDALKKSHQEGEDRHRSELCSLYVRENKDKFVINFVKPPSKLMRKDLRLTVDYPEDLIVCRAVYKNFRHKAPLIPLFEVVDFLDRNTPLIELIAPFCEEGYKIMYI